MESGPVAAATSSGSTPKQIASRKSGSNAALAHYPQIASFDTYAPLQIPFLWVGFPVTTSSAAMRHSMKPTISTPHRRSCIWPRRARFLCTWCADPSFLGPDSRQFPCRPTPDDFFGRDRVDGGRTRVKHLVGAVFGGKTAVGWSKPISEADLYPGPNPWQQTLQQKFALSDEMRRYGTRP